MSNNDRSQFSVIYDFETLSKDRFNCVILCIAGLKFDQKRFTSDDPYTFEGLLRDTSFMKFDVQQQVKTYQRKIDMDTVRWWKEKPAKIQDMLLEPAESDSPFYSIVTFIKELIPNENLVDMVFTRGNTFDPIILKGITEQLKSQDPYPFYKDRDTRSFIDGLTFGADMRNDFMVPGLEEKFIAHDPRHDIVMDVMRMQYVVRLLNDLETVV